MAVIYQRPCMAYAMSFEAPLAGDDVVREQIANIRRKMRHHPAIENMEAYFVAHDNSTRERFSRKNEIVMFF